MHLHLHRLWNIHLNSMFTFQDFVYAVLLVISNAGSVFGHTICWHIDGNVAVVISDPVQCLS